MTYTVTIPILWTDAIEFVVALLVALIIYWLWRLILGLVT